MKVSRISYVPTPSEVKVFKKGFQVVDKPNDKTNESTNLSFFGRVNPYLKELAKGLTNEIGEKVKPSQLKSVMTKEEFAKVIPKLTEQNYVASVENVKNGTFIADLHAHTLYSDGRITVKNMLEQAAEYGNQLKNINGKPFIFALSDHDGIKGDIEALKIISENPKKYENIKFIPATELSFVVPCEAGSRRAERYKTDVQMPEVLVYNINPFSETSKQFFNDLHLKREKMTSEMINEANQLRGLQLENSWLCQISSKTPSSTVTRAGTPRNSLLTPRGTVSVREARSRVYFSPSSVTPRAVPLWQNTEQ